jgi:hypothetical protein
MVQKGTFRAGPAYENPTPKTKLKNRNRTDNLQPPEKGKTSERIHKIGQSVKQTECVQNKTD